MANQIKMATSASIVELYERGWSKRRIARELGLDRETVARKAVHQLLAKFFAGSASELVLTFLREEEITPEELDAIKERILEAGKDTHEDADTGGM